MEYVLNQLKNLLAIPSPSGFTQEAAKYTFNEFANLGFAPVLTRKNGVIVCLGGEGNAALICAHIDTLGAMVHEVKSNGRLKITRVGGIPFSNIDGENCRVFTRDGKAYDGTFQLNNPSVHVNTSYAETKRDADNMEVVIDEKVASKDETLALGISVGNYVCFDPRTTVTESGFLKSRFLDDKLSVAILLQLARAISQNKIKLSRKVYVYITGYEEVGHGASSSLPKDVCDIIAVDMGCVGEGLSCTEHQVSICAKDSAGPSDYYLTSELINLAKANKLDYAVDIYPSYGSDVDEALRAGLEARHCVIGPGVYASHGYERSHVDGVKNTLELLKAYVTS